MDGSLYWDLKSFGQHNLVLFTGRFSCDLTASVQVGRGFTVQRVSAGRYRVTLNQGSFRLLHSASQPAIHATGSNLDFSAHYGSWGIDAVNSFDVYTQFAGIDTDLNENVFVSFSVFVCNTSEFHATGTPSVGSPPALSATLGSFSVRLYGAVGDGATDDTAAIDSAIAAAVANGGGEVYFPAGTYLTDGHSMTGVTGVYLSGDGIGASVLRQNAGGSSAVVAYDTCVNVGARRMTFDGNRDNASGHGIDAQEMTGLYLDEVEVKECDGTGIEIDGGTNRQIFVRAVHVHHTSHHGIRFKSIAGLEPGDGATDLVSAQFSDCFVWQFGLDGANTYSSGIYASSPANICNSFSGAFGVVGDGSSIGIRIGSDGDGAHRSAVSNCFTFPDVRGNGAEGTFPDFTDATEGIRIEANNCRVTNCTPHGSYFGVRVQGVRNFVAFCYADQCAYSFFAEDGAGFTRFSYCAGTGNVGPGEGFRVDADGVWVEYCYARLNNHYGVVVESTASNATILGCELTGNVDGPISDSGTGTRVLYNVGAGDDEFLSLGGTPSANGLLRLTAALGGVKFKNSSGTNITALELSASDILIVGDSSGIGRVDCHAATAFRAMIGGALRFEVSNLVSDLQATEVRTTGFFSHGASGVTWRRGTGSPEGAVSAPVGSLFSRTDGGASTSLYVKETGTGNTGWRAAQTA